MRIKADILLLQSSDANDLCFIETSNLDGETNLKQKRVIDVKIEENLENFNYYISTQKPNADLNTFQGYVTTLKTDENVKKGLRNDNIIYRGCALRNTDSIKGLVIYAGCNAKAMLSNQGIFHKTSK